MNDPTRLRSERARLAALTRWANVPPAERSRQARDRFRRHFENLVDPEGKLPVHERAALTDSAIAAHMARLRYQRVRHD